MFFTSICSDIFHSWKQENPITTTLNNENIKSEGSCNGLQALECPQVSQPVFKHAGESGGKASCLLKRIKPSVSSIKQAPFQTGDIFHCTIVRLVAALIFPTPCNVPLDGNPRREKKTCSSILRPLAQQSCSDFFFEKNSWRKVTENKRSENSKF